METQFGGASLEILGCGVISDGVLRNAHKDPTKEFGWAFGIGVDRWTMKLFGIPDIKLLWSDNPRFLRQFQKDRITHFVEYSKQPACYRDVSFWTKDNNAAFAENEFFELAREVAGDLVEYIKCIDVYQDKKRACTSRCYRISYCHRDKSLTNEEVDVFHRELRGRMSAVLGVTLR